MYVQNGLLALVWQGLCFVWCYWSLVKRISRTSCSFSLQLLKKLFQLSFFVFYCTVLLGVIVIFCCLFVVFSFLLYQFSVQLFTDQHTFQFQFNFIFNLFRGEKTPTGENNGDRNCVIPLLCCLECNQRLYSGFMRYVCSFRYKYPTLEKRV